MKLFVSVRRRLPQVSQMDASECREAFLHASESWRRSEAVDRFKIGKYIDSVLDAWLELQ